MTSDSWRGFDVERFNARTARSRERGDDAQHRTAVEQTCNTAPPGNPHADPDGVPRGAAPITLVLPFPPSTNHDKGGTYHLKPDTRAFRRAVADIVHSRRAGAVSGRLAITLTLYPAPTRHAFDVDNRIKPLLDALQNAGAFTNDEQVDFLHVHRVYGVAADARAERCLVTITPLDASA